jgi:hypothetical protein
MFDRNSCLQTPLLLFAMANEVVVCFHFQHNMMKTVCSKREVKVPLCYKKNNNNLVTTTHQEL